MYVCMFMCVYARINKIKVTKLQPSNLLLSTVNELGAKKKLQGKWVAAK